MGTIDDVLTAKQAKRLKHLVDSVTTGKYKLWTLSNQSPEFDNTTAINNFEKLAEAKISLRHMEHMKEVYGD